MGNCRSAEARLSPSLHRHRRLSARLTRGPECTAFTSGRLELRSLSFFARSNIRRRKKHKQTKLLTQPGSPWSEVEGPPRSATQAPRAHTVSRRPRRGHAGGPRTSPTIVRRTRSHARSLWCDWSPHCPEAHKLSRRKLLVNCLHDLLRELLGAR